MSDRPRMIFHAPYPLNREATSASGIRPVKMADAFEQIGYEVWLVTGYTRERAAQYRKVRKAVAEGKTFRFCYSESSTMPMTMTNPNHLPTRPLLDRSFLSWLKRSHIPVGHFLRDIYWAFPDYRKSVRPPKREAALLAYRWDMATLRKTLDVLYLPSLAMAEYLNIGDVVPKALPPGHGFAEPEPGPTKGAHLLYVGALGEHYRLEILVKAVEAVASRGGDCSLTVCTSPASWESQKSTYEPLIGPATKVVHASGAGLLPLYRAANVAALYVAPDEYRTFAMPVKLFEYLGQRKPIIATEGTLAGDFVGRNNAGWRIPYNEDDCINLLRSLANDASLIDSKRQSMDELAQQHTWAARARQVASDLTPSSR